MGIFDSTQEKRRKWVNKQFQKRVKGTHMSNKAKARLMDKLWKKAKKKYK